MNMPYMKCGHVANATCNGKPCCIICDCFEVATEKPNQKHCHFSNIVLTRNSMNTIVGAGDGTNRPQQPNLSLIQTTKY